jgi:hypothetical protein
MLERLVPFFPIEIVDRAGLKTASEEEDNASRVLHPQPKATARSQGAIGEVLMV